MSYEVRAEPEVSQDLAELEATDPELVAVAIGVMLSLREDPWLGVELRERYNLRALEGCRRIAFDVPGWPGKPRFRLVYRNEPTDGTPALVRIWGVGARAGLIACGRSTARIGRGRARALRRRRPPPR